ncbi:MAG: hypothetical protein RR826_06775, partial [Christensenellaceae bacterium]
HTMYSCNHNKTTERFCKGKSIGQSEKRVDSALVNLKKRVGGGHQKRKNIREINNWGLLKNNKICLSIKE